MAGELDAVPVAGPHAASMTAARHRSIVRTGNSRWWIWFSVQPASDPARYPPFRADS